jgi:hypothetical protein
MTEVSEEVIAFIIRMKTNSELVTGNDVPSSPSLFTLMMEAIRSSGT